MDKEGQTMKKNKKKDEEEKESFEQVKKLVDKFCILYFKNCNNLKISYLL